MKLFVPLLLSALFVGCGGIDEPSPEGSGTTETSEGTTGGAAEGDSPDAAADQSDPLQVLERFVEAIRAKDKEACLALVHPKDREELARDMDGGFPPVPENPELAVEVSGDSATFTGVPALDKLELLKSDGKWWIAD